MKIVYLPLPGKQLTGKQAKIYGHELQKLAHQRPLEPSAVVAAATPLRSLLHPYFTWDNDVAAAEYRLVEARCLLRSIGIVVQTREGPQLSRAFHCVNAEGEDRASWYDSETIFSDEELRGRVLRGALAELQGWRCRYQRYLELSGIIREIRIVERNVSSRHGVVKAGRG